MPLSGLRITRDDGLRWYQSSDTARRGFCRHCGSSLFWEPAGEARMSIAGGVFDTPTGQHTQKHIYVADKGDYYDIEAGPACFD